MGTVFFVALVALAGLSFSYKITPRQLIAATNRARVRPSYYATLIRDQYLSKGIRGIPNDPNCYGEAEALLRTKAPMKPYKENIVADCAAITHSNWMDTTKIFSHTGIYGTNARTRLEMYGTWPPEYFAYNENIGYISSPSATANTFTIGFLADCGVPGRGHRNNIFSTTVDQYGCGQTGFYVACVGTAQINLKATGEQLKFLGLSLQVNGVGFSGN